MFAVSGVVAAVLVACSHTGRPVQIHSRELIRAHSYTQVQIKLYCEIHGGENITIFSVFDNKNVYILM